MSDHTQIAWTDSTWNPVTGCTKVSPGCIHCYIERTPPFRMEGRKFDQPGIGGSTGVRLHADRLDQPTRWRKPRRIFVCSLADLFHDDVPDQYIARVWETFAAAPQHQFQVLTKRPARMASLLSSEWFFDRIAPMAGAGGFPLPNVWCGTSAEDQKWADVRGPHLRRFPAAVRFLSVEPMIGPIVLGGSLEWVDWVICGGESGPGARPMEAEWALNLQTECVAAGVSFFFKQAGSVLAKQWGCSEPKGHLPEEWPVEFRQEYPVELGATVPTW